MLVLRLLNIILLLALVGGVVLSFYLMQRRAMAAHKAKLGEIPRDAGVRDLVAQGRTQEAVDLYQKFTGVDPFTAQQAIDDMIREIRLSESVNTKIERLLKSDNKAAAIEAYQEATDAELAEALEYVERLQEKP